MLIKMSPTIDHIWKWKSKMPPTMTAESEAAYVESVEERQEVDKLVENLEVPTTEQTAYTAFALEVQSAVKKHAGAIAQTEANIAKQKALARGLNNAQLTSIMTHFNV